MELSEKQIKREEKYLGRIINVYHDTVVLGDGTKAGRDVVSHSGGVCVCALNEENEIYLVRQFRYPHGKVTIELPAGKLEWGEEPFDCGRRELREETGFIADEYKYLGCLLPTPAYDTEVIHMYLARGLHQDKQKLDEGEFLEVMKVPLEKAVEMVMQGEIEDAKTQIAVLKTAVICGKDR